MTFEPGERVRDKLNEENTLVVVEVLDTTIDEQVASYDHNKNPITVYDLEKDKDYDCSADENAVKAVYLDQIINRMGKDNPTIEEINDYLERKKLKPYYFPESRLIK